MSKTGKYIWDAEAPSCIPGKKGSWVKVSERANLRSSCYFTEPYYSESLDKVFTSKDQKRNFLKEKGYAEAG